MGNKAAEPNEVVTAFVAVQFSIWLLKYTVSMKNFNPQATYFKWLMAFLNSLLHKNYPHSYKIISSSCMLCKRSNPSKKVSMHSHPFTVESTTLALKALTNHIHEAQTITTSLPSLRCFTQVVLWYSGGTFHSKAITASPPLLSGQINLQSLIKPSKETSPWSPQTSTQ